MSSLGGAAVAVGGLGVLTACDPFLKRRPDGNGLLLPPGFRSRVVATTGQEVATTGYQWHSSPDGGACFRLEGGGWSYVSNSESVPGGVGYIRFDRRGRIVDAGASLTGTIINCAGGTTPWGTWLSCEEFPGGRVFECDPVGATPGVVRPALGVFKHEAAAWHFRSRAFYLTEDERDGALYRFRPAKYGDLSAGTLEVLTERAGGRLGWVEVPNPGGGAPDPTRYQVPDTKVFEGGEGIDISRGRVIFTTKFDGRVWSYDPGANTLEVIYEDGVSPNGVLSGLDNVEVSRRGVIYVAEDGGDMQIVLVRNDGRTYPVVEVTDVDGSEITGPAFDPSGRRLYFSSQRNPGTTYEVTGPWWLFTRPGRATT